MSIKYVTTLPARVWNPETHPGRSEACAAGGRRLEEHLQACLAALFPPGMHCALALRFTTAAMLHTTCPALQSIHLNQLDAGCVCACSEEFGQALDASYTCAGPRLESGDTPSLDEAGGSGKRLLVHNLFAMEAISIAEALGVPSLALSPCLVPQAPPASLERQFKREHAALYIALTKPGASNPHSRDGVCRGVERRYLALTEDQLRAASIAHASHNSAKVDHSLREQAFTGCASQRGRRADVWDGLMWSTGCGPSSAQPPALGGR